VDLVFAILAVGVLIVVHEAGHYFVARWCKMRVDRFSIGFGPPLLKWKRGETDFTIGPIPFGGFVQIHGMLPSDEIDKNDTRAYPNRPTWQRFVTIFAGPGTNYLFAIVMALALYGIAGVPTRWNVVASVDKEYEAAGKLEPGDRIISINGESVYQVRHGMPQEPMSTVISRIGPKPVRVAFLRNGVQQEVTITPKLNTNRGPDDPEYRLGIGFDPRVKHEEWQREGVVTTVVASVAYPIIQTKMIIVNLADIITGKQEGKFSGPVEIVKMVKDSIQLGWVHYFGFVMLLNVYLGLFNLLPLPALDGGRLAFLSYELATRRRPNPKIEAAVHMVGIMTLFVILILVTYRDIADLF
jgi:regulator of sigma E protease